MIRLTRAEVREIDRRAIERYHIPGIVLMENAARAVVDKAVEMIPPDDPEIWMITIVCGAGNNGGDGFAAARHLRNRGFYVNVRLLVEPTALKGDALINYQILSKMMPVHQTDGRHIFPSAVPKHIVIDAIFGTGLTRPPQPPFSTAIDQINASEVPVLAVDVPSGLDCDSGEPLGACIRAERTVTFVAEKSGFANPDSKQYTGDITVADIGCPRELIEEVAKMPSP